MTSWSRWQRISNRAAALALCALATAHAQSPTSAKASVGERTPTARLVPASRLDLPGEIDSSNPAVWSRVDGIEQLFVISSWGGVPVRSSGPSIDALTPGAPVGFNSHPGHGVWMEAIIPDESSGAWYGYYHHERPADLCGRADRQLPRIGAVRSRDDGRTWDDLGIVLDAPAGSEACESNNRFVLGGVGDVTAALDANRQDVYLYFSQYVRDGASQGVAVARIAWADRDAPVGKAAVWNAGAWLPARDADGGWSYPLGTPLVASQRPFHDGNASNDVFWGASIHWNTHLEHYVMLLNRAKDDQFANDGIYVAFSPTLAEPSRWSAPVKLLGGGQWYPQVIGQEPGVGSDRIAGKRARFFILGRSDRFIEFER